MCNKAKNSLQEADLPSDKNPRQNPRRLVLAIVY